MRTFTIDNVAFSCGDFPAVVLDTAYNRFTQEEDKPWANIRREIYYRGVEVDSRFLMELAECCFRWGLSDQLAEIIAGPWGNSLISGMVANSTSGKSPRKQTPGEAKIVSGNSTHKKSRHMFRNLRDEVNSILGIACGLLWNAEKNWHTCFPTRVVETYKHKSSGISYTLRHKPVLFEAFFPLSGKTLQFSSNLTDEQRDEGLEVVCSTNRSENPDHWQSVSFQAVKNRTLSEKHWGTTDVSYLKLSNRSSFGSNILKGKLRPNVVLSALYSAAYGYIRHEYGNGAEFMVNRSEWESTDLWHNYQPYTATNFVEECPAEVLAYLADSGKVTKTALKIVRALQSRAAHEIGNDFNLGDVLSLVNATRGEGEKEMNHKTLYTGWYTLIETAKQMMAEEIQREELSFGAMAKNALS